jgi:uncharacterized protein YndB with AHSA1/START domain
MHERSSFVADPGRTTFFVTRIFEAPRRRVFEAWTRPEHLARWWGPRGFTLTVCEVDLRAGGTWRFVQRGPDGSEHPFKGVYREVTRWERLAYTFAYDVDGHRERSAVVTVALEDLGGRTKVTITTSHRTVEERDAHFRRGKEGMAETMERLADHLHTQTASDGFDRQALHLGRTS